MTKLYDGLNSWLRAPTNSGRHQTLFALAARLAEEGYDEDQAYEVLRNACDESLSRSISDREVTAAVRDGFAKASGEVVDTGPKWPVMDADLIRSAIRGNEPLPLEPIDMSADEIIPQLFNPEEILYVARGIGDGQRVAAADWRTSMDSYEFITPNPYGSFTGLTKQGDPTSGNCADGILCRRYIIVEFDLAPDGLPFSRNAQASILAHLATTAPLVMVVHSGGKSMHGWFAAPNNLEQWFADAVRLGADPALWRIQQLTRLPGGLRQNGHRQEILWWGLNERKHST